MADPAPTPLPTKVILVATLAVTAAGLGAFLATRSQPVDPRHAAVYLALFSALFLLRVAGQVVVRLRGPLWLPPTEQWNLTPYRILLPTQVGILGLLGWIDADFASGRGFWADAHPALGRGVLWFALVYAVAMAVRYLVRMSRQPEHRWFGGAIPIVFHGVLAGYLVVFGSYHASR
jgi:hypothetical protein